VFRLFRSIWTQVKKYLITGLMVWVPLIITVWVSWLVIQKVGVGLDTLFRNLFQMLKLQYWPGLGFLSAVAIFMGTGVFARYLVGKRIIAFTERFLDRIPFISRVYRAVQQIRDVFVTRNGTVFQYVCLVQYPRSGMFAVGFVTSAEQGLVQATVGRELVSVFVPTTPNPTSGYLVFLAPEEIQIVDMPVEEAMKLIVSGGAYLPSKHGKLKVADNVSDTPTAGVRVNGRRES